MTDQTSPQPEKFCKDCRYVLGRRGDLDSAKRWGCNAPQNLLEGVPDFVIGEKTHLHKYSTCYEARAPELTPSSDQGCGPEGKWFILYVYPAELYNKHPSPQPPLNVDSLLDELENL